MHRTYSMRQSRAPTVSSTATRWITVAIYRSIVKTVTNDSSLFFLIGLATSKSPSATIEHKIRKVLRQKRYRSVHFYYDVFNTFIIHDRGGVHGSSCPWTMGAQNKSSSVASRPVYSLRMCTFMNMFFQIYSGWLACVWKLIISIAVVNCYLIPGSNGC